MTCPGWLLGTIIGIEAASLLAVAAWCAVRVWCTRKRKRVRQRSVDEWTLRIQNRVRRLERWR